MSSTNNTTNPHASLLSLEGQFIGTLVKSLQDAIKANDPQAIAALLKSIDEHTKLARQWLSPASPSLVPSLAPYVHEQQEYSTTA